MEIREIDGKKFVEYEPKQKRKIIISVSFLILMAIAVIALINATFVLIENKDIIQKDPLRYGMDVHGFVSCQCSDSQGKEWYSNGTGFIHTERNNNWINYSLSENQINFTKFEVKENRPG